MNIVLSADDKTQLLIAQKAYTASLDAIAILPIAKDLHRAIHSLLFARCKYTTETVTQPSEPVGAAGYCLSFSS